MLTATVRGFGDSEITEGVVDHYSARFEATSYGLAAGKVAGENAGGQSEIGIVAAGDGFLFVSDDLNGEDRAESFFLKKPHRLRDAGDYRGRKEIGAEVGARVATAENSCAEIYGIVDQGLHALDLLWADQRADIRGGIVSGTDAEFLCLLHAQLEEFFSD